MTCGMGKMYLNWDTSVPHIFFEWWTATTPFTFALSLLIVFILAFIYEGVISFRSRYESYICLTGGILSEKLSTGKNLDRVEFTIAQNAIRAALYAFSCLYSLFMMMIFMLYNGYLIISQILGGFSGYFFFAVYVPLLVCTND